jgi:hypothetical protein
MPDVAQPRPGLGLRRIGWLGYGRMQRNVWFGDGKPSLAVTSCGQHTIDPVDPNFERFAQQQGSAISQVPDLAANLSLALS